jgi:hypothetical protein
LLSTLQRWNTQGLQSKNNKICVASSSAKKPKNDNLNPDDDFFWRICGPFLAVARKQSDMEYYVGVSDQGGWSNVATSELGRFINIPCVRTTTY